MPLSRSSMVSLGHCLQLASGIEPVTKLTLPPGRNVCFCCSEAASLDQGCVRTHVFFFYQQNPALESWVATFCSRFTFTKPFQIRALSCLIAARNLSLHCADQGRIKLVCWPMGQTGVHQLYLPKAFRWLWRLLFALWPCKSLPFKPVAMSIKFHVLLFSLFCFFIVVFHFKFSTEPWWEMCAAEAM